MLLPKRHGSVDVYRYGFQGQEKDDEIKGEGNSLNYKYRMHDPRVGRFFEVDPLSPQYPHYSPYSFSGNKVIAHVELEGLEEIYYGNVRKDKKVDNALTLMTSTDLGLDAYREIWNTEGKKTPTDIYFVLIDMSDKKHKLFGTTRQASAFTRYITKEGINPNGRIKAPINTLGGDHARNIELGLYNMDFSRSVSKNIGIIFINTSDDSAYFKKQYSDASGSFDETLVPLAETIYHELVAHIVAKIKNGITNQKTEHLNYHGQETNDSPLEPKPGTPAAKFIEESNKVLNQIKDLYNKLEEELDKNRSGEKKETKKE